MRLDAGRVLAYFEVFLLVKENFIHDMEHFDWWKHLTGIHCVFVTNFSLT